MTREEIILSAPKKQGLRVHVLDHCDKKALIEKYRRHEVNIENIEEVDSSAGIAAEYFLTVVSKGGRIAWDAKEKGEFEFVHSLEQAKQAIRDVGERGSYLNVHEWCFTPTSFRLMMRDLFELGFIQLKELAFHPSQGSEFYIALSRAGVLPPGTRLDLLLEVLREQSVT